ncbi:MAG: hypothetical protein J5710_06110 [Treponema sp.]|nr:hypothetical protein [Treponema sp.]
MIRWRFEKLIEKLLSVKFVIFIVATVLLSVGVLGCGEWLTIALAVIAGREAQKYIGRKKNCEESLGSD